MVVSQSSGAFHRLTIVPMIAGLENLGNILTKAQGHANDTGVDKADYLQQRLFSDMFTLNQQLLYALYLPCDFARHFTDTPPPRAGYDEKSFEEVQASIGAVTKYLRSISAGKMDELAKKIVPSFFDGKRGVVAEYYAARVSMPDFYFHLSVAYAILRHNGVPLAKMDYLGQIESVALS